MQKSTHFPQKSWPESIITVETIELRSIHRNIIRSILRRYKLSRTDILGVLVFGSIARGQAHKRSDLDLIIIKKDDILNYERLQYHRNELNKVSIDLNIMSPNCCIELLHEPDWQYRLYDSRLASSNDMTKSNRLGSWLAQINKTIETNDSRNFRIFRYFSDIDDLIVKKDMSCSRDDKIVELFILVEIAILITKISIEKMKFLPYRAEKNIISFLRRVDHSSVSCRNSMLSWWDHFVNQIQRNNPECTLRRYKNITELILKWVDKTREDAEKINGRVGILHKSALELDASELDRLNKVIAWPFDGELNKEEFFSSLLRILDSEKNRFLKSQEEPKVWMRNQFPKKSNKLRKGSSKARLAYFDESNKRLKIILPTGGCRTATCSFCCLPYIARVKPLDLTPTQVLLPYLENDIEEIAIYCDGSFFDNRELTRQDREEIAEATSTSKIKRLTIESLPRFISYEVIQEFLYTLNSTVEFILAVGLQSISEKVRRFSTGTPISQNEIMKLFEIKDRLAFNLRIYLLAGKPLMTIKEDYLDLYSCCEFLNTKVDKKDRVIINPIFVAHRTPVEVLRDHGWYKQISACTFRNYIEELRRAFPRIRIDPGTISNPSCINGDQGLAGCPNCKQYLMDYKTQKSKRNSGNIKERRCVTKNPDDLFDLPWPAIGDLERRSTSIYRVLNS